MQRRQFLGSILAAGGSAVALMAQDASKHKGKPLMGEVTATGADGFELKTAKGVRKISVTAKTKFERGDETVSFSDITEGSHVTVFGTVLGDGNEVVAKEVVVPGDSKHGHHGGGHMKH